MRRRSRISALDARCEMQVTARGSRFTLDVGGEGEAVLFVHGFPLDRWMWRPLFDALLPTHCVIAPDLRGFGDSTEPATPMTMADYADDLAAVLDAAEIRSPMTLCGLSMGGYIAFEFFKRHRARLARLVLCDTKAAADALEKKEERERTAEEVLRNGTTTLVQQMPEALLAPTTRENHPELVERVREMVRNTSCVGAAAALRAMAARSDATELLATIDVPTLVICGEMDRISPPAEMEAMAEQIPEATFLTIPSAGHLAPLENPETVLRAMRRFLGVR